MVSTEQKTEVALDFAPFKASVVEMLGDNEGTTPHFTWVPLALGPG